MSDVFPFVINIVNTAFGVTVLAVPYCFHQCGLILGGLLLVLSSHASKISCSLLLRSGQISRKRDFESLGFHVGGFLGKLIVEMSLIGYLVGTAIGWFVIIGDVAPAVVSTLIGIEKSWQLRLFLIVAIGVCVVLPLALVKDITSLSSASNVAIGIYTLFVLQLFFSTLPKILAGDWISGVNFWKPYGVLQCLPIFAISFLCQTVIFVLYEAMPEPSVKKMENVVNKAMDIVLLLSFTVGFSGYVMYFDAGIEGDLLNNYKHDFISEFIRLGFCISTILSFPLLVFPCRASINSLISSTKMNAMDVTPAGGTYIPHDRFFIITCSLIIGTMLCGVLFPNVEFVMALVGATMGAMLTFILPSYIFLNVGGEVSSKTEAKVLFVLGVCLFCLSTFSVLSISESQAKVVDMAPVKPVLNLPTIKLNKTLVTPTVSLKKLEELVNKIEKTNESVVHRGDHPHEEEKRSIDGERITKTQRNTAKVIKESRKEPALPQEGLARQLPDKSRQLAEQGVREQSKLAETKRQSEGVRHQEPEQMDVKPRLKEEDKNAQPRSDEVRIGERKILNNGQDVSYAERLMDSKTTETDVNSQRTTASVKLTKSETNVSITNQPTGREITENLRNKTNTGLQVETKPSSKNNVSLTYDSDARKTRIRTFRRIQSPLILRKQLYNMSSIRIIQRHRRKILPDKREI